ncbi:unnamed protein product [Parascedosporium putredinis]|uniref:Uncharacterized protein n=1 Tax=Parascedosporium putredinis TaxID=1442378 RepID=A0A9P1MDL0_9PEZI|nr:unnamed protein product [Parascedosporium putredinis]CAI7998767.1 unnamed protein product [Parascedosporium putredinis]
MLRRGLDIPRGEGKAIRRLECGESQALVESESSGAPTAAFTCPIWYGMGAYWICPSRRNPSGLPPQANYITS